MFLCIFQDFNSGILKKFTFLYKTNTLNLLVIHGYNLSYVARILPFLPVSGSPSRVRLCPSCLRCFGDLRKKTGPWILEHAFCGFCDFWVILAPLAFFPNMADLIKWLCQQDARRNSVQEAGSNAPRCFFELISLVILGMIEPWAECQPEQSWEWCLGVLWVPLAVPWGPFGRLTAPVGSLWGTLGYLVASSGFSWKLDVVFQANVAFSRYCCSKSSLPWFSCRAPPCPRCPRCPAKWC